MVAVGVMLGGWVSVHAFRRPGPGAALLARVLHTHTAVVGQSRLFWVATTPVLLLPVVPTKWLASPVCFGSLPHLQINSLVPRTGEGALLGTRVAPGLSRGYQCYVGTHWMHCHNRIVHMTLVCVSVILPAALPDRLAHYAGVCLRSCLL